MRPSANRIRWSIVCFTFLSLLVSQNASGTVIYLRVSQDEVVVAADSKRTFLKANGNTDFVSVCKILRVNGVVFTSAGISGDTGDGFDVEEVARRAIKAGGALREVVQGFQKSITSPLVRALEIIRVRDPLRYRGFLRGAVVQTVFIRVENGSLVVKGSIITPVEDSSGKITLAFGLYSCPGQCDILPDTVSIGGSPRANRIQDTVNDFWGKGSVEGLRELLKISIADNPSETGEPIDILRITKSGAEWAQVKEGCKE